MPLIEVIHSSNSIDSSSSNAQNNDQPLQEETAPTTALSTGQTREEQDSLTSIAREAIQSLVEHYRQPIHLITAVSSVDNEGKQTTITNDSLPPFVEHWLRRLQHELLPHRNTNLMITMVQSLVHSYVTSIRSTLLVMDQGSGLYQNEESSTLASVNPNGVPVLVHYELLLSQFLQRQEVVAITKDEKDSKSTGNDDGIVPPLNNTEDGMNNSKKNTAMANVTTTFAEALLCMACDITRLTSFCSSMKTSNGNNDPSSGSSPWASSMSDFVPNVVLPTMVRLLQRIQSYIQKSKESFTEMRATTASTADDDSGDDDILTSAMRRCDVSILAFGMPCLGPLQIHGDLGRRTDTNTVLQRYTIYPPTRPCSSIASHKSMDPTLMTTTRCNSEEQNSSSSSSNCYMSTSFVQSDGGKAWEQDPVTLAALAYWKMKSSSACVTSRNDCDAKSQDDCSSLMRDAQQRYFSTARRQESCDNKNNTNDRQSFLLSMARAVRAHFFGRDMRMPISSASTSCTAAVGYTMDNRGMSRNQDGHSTITTVQHQQGLQLHQQRQQQHQNQPRLHLGRWTTTKPSWSKGATQAPFRVIPSRIHVACQFISLLTVEDEVFVACKNGSHKSISIAEELLPIVMELLSAPVYAMQAWGATCLLHLLSMEATTTIRRHDDALNDPFWTLNPVQMDNLLSLLQLNIQACREGPVLAVLGMAQQELLRRSFMDDTKRQSLARRKATQEWLLLLSKNLHSYQHSSDNNHLVWGVLVGGIAPLFYDHCTLDEDPDASLIELGRLGLLSLLDLIRNAYQSYSILEDEDDVEQIDVDDRMEPLLSDSMKHKAEQQDIQLLAILALSNLMVAAHPIMPHHGGKIMCALLSACCSCTAVRDCEGESVMTKTVTAIADSSPVVFDWAYHVASMAIVSSGKRAIDILDMIPQEKDKEQDDDDYRVVTFAAQEIKRRAEVMMTTVLSATKSY